MVVNELHNSRRNRIDFTTDDISVLQIVEQLFEELKTERRIISTLKENFIRHILIITLDLFNAWDGDPTKYIGYSRGSNNFRSGGAYWNNETDEPIIGEKIYLGVVDFLAAHEYIENEIAPSGYQANSSRMRANKKLIKLFIDHGVSWVCTQVNTRLPVIIVKDENKNIIPLPDPGKFDLETTTQNVQRINANLQSTLINLKVTDAQFEVLKVRLAGELIEDNEGVYREPFELSNRSLKRIFSMSSFAKGGRFYGGWWQGIPNEYRKHIEIEGQATVEIDYATMQPHILYGSIGHEPPADSYALDGWSTIDRKVIKKAFNQIVNCDPLCRPESMWRLFAPDLESGSLPTNWSNWPTPARNGYKNAAFRKMTGRGYQELLRDLVKLHAPIDDLLFTKKWGLIQNTDAQVAEKVMIRLLDQSPSITALPIHDSFIVPYSAKETLLDTMRTVFEEVLGIKCKVKVDITVFDPPEEFGERANFHTYMSDQENLSEVMTDYTMSHIRATFRELDWANYQIRTGEKDEGFSYNNGRLIPDPQYWNFLSKERRMEKRQQLERMGIYEQYQDIVRRVSQPLNIT